MLQNYAYQNDFTFFESSTPQTTLLYLKVNGIYQVTFVGGGGGASASSCAYHGSHPGNPGAGGQVSISSDLIVKDLFLKTNGLNGVGEAGGNSVYSGTTYGKGGNAYSNPGNSGYVKVKLL